MVGEFDRLNLLSGTTFSTRRLRPETEENHMQRVLRFMTGLKVYPTDTRRARLRNLREINKWLSIEVGKERRANTRAAMEEVQKALAQYGGKRD